METRGRGREARASTDDVEPPTNRLTDQLGQLSAPNQQSSTRSRVRLRTVTFQSNHPTRGSRSPAPNPVVRFLGQSSQGTQNLSSTTGQGGRVRRASATRRAAAVSAADSAISAATQLQASATAASFAPTAQRQQLQTRKRTRSSSRKQISHISQPSGQGQPSRGALGQHGRSLESISVPPSTGSAVAAPLSTRPFKRVRKGSYGSCQFKGTATSSGEQRIPGAREPIRLKGEMDLPTSRGSSDEQENRNQEVLGRTDEDAPNSVGSDGAETNTLHGLLRRLGADLSDIFPGNNSNSHTRIHQLRSAISSPESEHQQISALSELCEFLSVGTEESLVSFSVNLFVPQLVDLLRSGNNVEIKIYAARALTHLMEAVPSSASSVANHGAAEPLCANLLSIEYIDLAEQSLSALHKLSTDYPQQVVHAKGFQAVLSYIDFFSIGMQRVAAATACNLCRHPRADAMEMIKDMLPTMMRLVDSDDQRIRESALLGFTKLAEAFRNVPAKLEALCGESAVLIEKILGLIVPSSPPVLAPQSYSSALRLLAIMSRGSALLGMKLFSTRSLILRLNAKLVSGSGTHCIDCLVLADSLLPDIPELEATQSYGPRPRRRRGIGYSVAQTTVDIKRREDLEKDTSSLQFFGQTLFSTLMKFYLSSADWNARRLGLSIMSKFIAISPRSVLCDVIGNRENRSTTSRKSSASVHFCPFVAALLSENSSFGEALVGLALTESALRKLPSLRASFVREGVIHEILRLARSGAQEEVDVEEGIAHPKTHDKLEVLAGSSETMPDTLTGELCDEPVAGVSFGSMDSIWSAVAALHRSNMNHGSRHDIATGSQRSHPRFSTEPWNGESAKILLPNAAKFILKTYLGTTEDGSLNEDILQNSILSNLKDICSLLDAAPSSSTESVQELKSTEGIVEFIEFLTSPEKLTVFEASKSGLMRTLAAYMNPSDLEVKASRLVTLVRSLNQRKGRGAFSSLVSLSLGVLSAEEKLNVQANEFGPGYAAASISSGMRQLAQPFKLRLKRASADSGGAGLRDYSHNVVLIEPLATMASVQEFLWPKVRESGQSLDTAGRTISRRRSSRSRAGNTEDWRGRDQGGSSRVVLSVENNPLEVHEQEEERYLHEEALEPEEDGSNSNRVVSIAEEADGSNDDLSSREGEEDLIEHASGESDDQEQESTEALEADHLVTSLPAFELHHDSFGQAPSRNQHTQANQPQDSSRFMTSSSHVSDDQLGPFRSYAAALASNMPQGSVNIGTFGDNLHRYTPSELRRGRGTKSLSAPKLVFALNGKEIPHECSILSAVVQSGAFDCAIGPRLWSDVHTLVYAKPCIQPRNAHTASLSARSRDHSKDTTQVHPNTQSSLFTHRSQRLQENSEQIQSKAPNSKAQKSSGCQVLPENVITSGSIPVLRKSLFADIPKSLVPVLEVLKELDWIYRETRGDVLLKKGIWNVDQGLQEETQVHFYSDRLSAKIITQLSNPLALCGGVVPAWCFTLSREAPFLIPFETRRMLFQSTALGVARALHLLQTRADISGLSVQSQRGLRGSRESEARIGRIQRQKVRLHRDRILQSAIGIMSLYSAHSTMLEVEYVDEVGTGLGPTLEFYTLTSREIQRVDLGLWRSQAPSPVHSYGTAGIDEDNGDTSDLRVAGRKTKAHLVQRRGRSQVQDTVLVNTSEGASASDNYPIHVIPTGNGLYPSCLSQTAESKDILNRIAYFRFVGRLVGKAVIDGRLLDLRFSKTFSRLLLAYCKVIYERRRSKENTTEFQCYIKSRDCLERGKLTVDDFDGLNREKVWDVFTDGNPGLVLLEDVDPQLATSLRAILNMLSEGDSDAIVSLCLTFVLPGDDRVELVKGGSSIEVTKGNAREFVQRVVYHVLFEGVCTQTEAVLQGLGEVLDVTSLLLFESDELQLLICGPSFEKWSIDFLVQATRCDHGYSHDSQAVLYFLRVLSEMDKTDQQHFVLFTTGSPSLPLGGLRNLHPKLTIVRREPEHGRSPDECLPTVMTCTNYFKLPDYSSLEIARKQVSYAIREGQGSFHLS